MTPDEICRGLDSIDAEVSRRTLLNYEIWGLIPEPKRGGGGRLGRFTDYPAGTIEEAFTAWSLIHGKYSINYAGDFFDDNVPKLHHQTVRICRDAYYYHLTREKERSSGDILETNIDECTMKKELEEQKNLVHKMQTLKGERMTLEDKMLVSQAEASSRIAVGYQVLWEAERMRAKVLLQERISPN